MKKCSSIVWKFFDRIEENKRCVAVLCKLCDRQYKYFGNTTNCRQHLVTKHPLQWELLMNGSLDESAIRVLEDEQSNNSTISLRKRKYTRDSEKNVDILESDVEGQVDEESEAAYHIVRQMHQSNPDEEWLEEEQYSTTHADTYESPQRKKIIYKRIKREIESPPRRLPRTSTQKPIKLEQPQPVIIEDRKDEYSVFGEYVANKLRKFKSPRTRGNIQQMVTTILWQAEYGMYEGPESVKRVLMNSIQEIQMDTMPVIHVHPQEEHTEPESNEVLEAESVEVMK